MTMMAARLISPSTIRCEEAPEPEQGPCDVLARTIVSAICGSDLHVVYGGWSDRPTPAPPGFPGHESVIEVLQDPTGRFASGELALAVPPASRSAAFAARQTLPSSALVPLQTDEDPRQLLLAQQLGTVIHGTRTFGAESLAGATVTVVGAGCAGLMFIHEALHRGASRVICSDPDVGRRAAAVEVGAHVAVDPSAQEVADVVCDLTDGTGSSLVIEASGTDAGRRAAIACLARDGVFGMFGLPERRGTSPFDLATLFERRAKLITTHGTQSEPGLAAFRSAVNRIRSRTFDPQWVRTHSMPLTAITEAFALARTQGPVHKILIIPEHE